MTKENVLKALSLCGTVACEDCPYHGMNNCDDLMCKDAIALIKGNGETNKSKYTMVCIYTKNGNLLPYFDHKLMINVTKEEAESMRKYYAREMEIQLIAMFRWENGKCFCKIKCPINPLPVKGEFEVPSTGVLNGFLVKEGWQRKQKFYPRMFE